MRLSHFSRKTHLNTWTSHSVHGHGYCIILCLLLVSPWTTKLAVTNFRHRGHALHCIMLGLRMVCLDGCGYYHFICILSFSLSANSYSITVDKYFNSLRVRLPRYVSQNPSPHLYTDVSTQSFDHLISVLLRFL